MKTFPITIQSIEKKFFQGEINSISLTEKTMGTISILKDHKEWRGLLSRGFLIWVDDMGKEYSLVIERVLVIVNKDHSVFIFINQGHDSLLFEEDTMKSKLEIMEQKLQDNEYENIREESYFIGWLERSLMARKYISKRRK